MESKEEKPAQTSKQVATLKTDDIPSKVNDASHEPYFLLERMNAIPDPDDDEIPFVAILYSGWEMLKKGLDKILTKAEKIRTNTDKPYIKLEKAHVCGSHGPSIIKVISWIQLVLGLICICLALIAIAAAFQVREFTAHDYGSEVLHKVVKLYRNHDKIITNEKVELKMYFKKEIQKLLDNNCSVIDNDHQIYDSHDYLQYVIDHVGYNSDTDQLPDYCQVYDCYQNEFEDKLENYYLIIDFLAVPSWTGILLIITGLVGFQKVTYMEKAEYHNNLHISYTFLNILGLLPFAPLMFTAGFLQMNLSSPSRIAFRYYVGITTVAFAIVIMLLSIICVINSCLKENYKKESSDDTVPEAKEKEQKKFDSVLIIA